MISFNINGNIFLEAISSIYPIVPNKPSRDILKCFKFSGTNNPESCLIIEATDLETFAIVKIVGDGLMVHNVGEIVVPASVILDYAKATEGTNMEFHVSAQELLTIKEGNTVFEVSLQDLDEYPNIPEVPQSVRWTNVLMPAIKKALRQVIFAVAEKGSPRWGTLNAVCLDVDGSELTFIGTDQHRASMVSLDIEDNLEKDTYLIPAKTLALIPKIFSDEVDISFDLSNNIIIKDSITTLMIRLMHGNFPAVRDFMPNHPNNLDLDVSEFLKQVKKASLAADKHSTLRVELSRNKIQLLAKTRQQRKSISIEYPIEYSGDTFKFAVNLKFMVDVLKASSYSESIKMHFNQNNQPILFTQNNFKHLIVPQEVR